MKKTLVLFIDYLNRIARKTNHEIGQDNRAYQLDGLKRTQAGSYKRKSCLITPSGKSA